MVSDLSARKLIGTFHVDQSLKLETKLEDRQNREVHVAFKKSEKDEPQGFFR